MRRRGVIWVVAAGAAAVMVTAVACGSAGTRTPDLARGKQIFLTGGGHRSFACAFCHTLRAAAAYGPLAPDLDYIFHQEKLTRPAFEKLVRDQIPGAYCLNPNDPGRCMPKDIVKGHDADDVAAYVANCAGFGRQRAPGCRPFPGNLPADVRVGRRLFSGCSGCHWAGQGTTAPGPLLDGLYGSKVELADGTTVVANDTYILESMLLPDKQIVKGYSPGYMSGTIKPGSLSSAQVKALLAYIKTLNG